MGKTTRTILTTEVTATTLGELMTNVEKEATRQDNAGLAVINVSFMTGCRAVIVSRKTEVDNSEDYYRG